MYKNIGTIDRYIRASAVFVLLVFFFITQNFLFLLPALALYHTVVTNRCWLYKLAGINKELEKEQLYLEVLPKHNPEPVMLFCDRGHFLYGNDAAKKLFSERYSASQLMHCPLERLRTTPATHTLKLHGRYYSFYMQYVPSRELFTAYGFDVTKLKRNEHTVKFQSITDMQTGAYNRRKLIETIDKSEYDYLGLVAFDIKNFGEFNGYFGFKNGDRFLKHIVTLLKDKLGSKERIFRIYGDVFTVLFESRSEHTLKREIIRFLRDYPRVEFSHDSLEMVFEFTVGVAITAKESKQELLNRAETSLMEAKKSDKKRVFYGELKGIKDRYEQNLRWSKDVQDALFAQKNRKIIPFYQPIYNYRTQSVEKYECLARMIDLQTGETFSPGLFLEAVRKQRLMHQLTRVIILNAFAHFADNAYEFSINLSIFDLENDVGSLLNDTAQRYGIKPSRVVLEILEDDDIGAHFDAIMELKARGYRIAIDDFGSGYSNFARLAMLRPEYLKIDGSLITPLKDDPKALETLVPIITYAGNIRAKTIAEFVADEQIAALAQDAGIDYAQGFYFGKPVQSLDQPLS